MSKIRNRRLFLEEITLHLVCGFLFDIFRIFLYESDKNLNLKSLFCKIPNEKLCKIGITTSIYTVDSRCLELGRLEFPVESNFYRSPELRCV
jgi:hypothetical protein